MDDYLKQLSPTLVYKDTNCQNFALQRLQGHWLTCWVQQLPQAMNTHDLSTSGILKFLQSVDGFRFHIRGGPHSRRQNTGGRNHLNMIEIYKY